MTRPYDAVGRTDNRAADAVSASRGELAEQQLVMKPLERPALRAGPHNTHADDLSDPPGFVGTRLVRTASSVTAGWIVGCVSSRVACR